MSGIPWLISTSGPGSGARAFAMLRASGPAGRFRKMARTSPVSGSRRMASGGSLPSRISTLPPGPENERLASSDSHSAWTGSANVKPELPP